MENEARQSYELWIQAIPVNMRAARICGGIHTMPLLGEWDRRNRGNQGRRFVDARRHQSVISTGLLMFHYTAMGRIDEAEATYREPRIARKFGNPPSFIWVLQYGLAFLRRRSGRNGATGGVGRRTNLAIEDHVSISCSPIPQRTSGGSENAREITRRAVDSAKRAGSNESGRGLWRAIRALREAAVRKRGDWATRIARHPRSSSFTRPERGAGSSPL